MEKNIKKEYLYIQSDPFDYLVIFDNEREEFRLKASVEEEGSLREAGYVCVGCYSD